MRDKGKFLIGIVFLAILAVFAYYTGNMPNVFAATWNQTNVTVKVESVSQLTILPATITWSSVNPGSVGGMTYVQVRNSGSTTINTLYAYADTLTTEPSNPIEAGTSDAFSSGGVIMIKKNETGAGYNITDRLEWNVSQPAGSGGTNCANAAAWGYYRNVSNEYVWCLKNGTAIDSTGGCNSTGTTFYIMSGADNGTVASRQPDLTGGSASAQAGWGVFSGFSTGPLAGYCVAASQNCQKILIYEYDKRTNPNFAACTNAKNLRDTTLTPGAEFTVNLDAWVPRGVPAGWLAPSWLTLEAGS